MLKYLLVVLALAQAGDAAAQSRQSTTRLTCAAAGALVERSGAVVLDTGGGAYERLVRDRSFCLVGESTRPTTAATTDNRLCVVGYICGNRENRTTR